MFDTNLPPILRIPPGITLVLRTNDHRITNLVVGAVGEVIPEESCHCCNMGCGLMYQNMSASQDGLVMKIEFEELWAEKSKLTIDVPDHDA